jgi:hypothetical protein
MGAKEYVKQILLSFIHEISWKEMMDENIFLKEGEVQNITMFYFLNKPTDGAINIVTSGDGYTIQTPFEGNFMRMADKLAEVTKDIVQPLMMRSLYSIGEEFVFPDPAKRSDL